ncbi:MAG: tryptophan--tRNA ligase [Deltaproteobacteria bacterium CG11_big_fil_rev_8_21_14_0_20_45_16]|nr:MAG: tryptophan--tRNA ligase [Deltaproteobacteria bacterium CG11_big_fil_rev_8_21_14_0_20_45_16]
MASIQKPSLLTGIRASGEIHLGNYLGAMKPAIARQDDYNCHLFIADLHGLTTSPPAEELRRNVRGIASAWLAAGLNPEKTIMWRQSDVAEVLVLSYVLSCVTSMGLLERAHSYKDAKSKDQVVKSGLFFYPVLMAADILLYDADFVPVGKDQAQHLEMTRDIATFFNETYGECLKLPREIIEKELALIPGTDGRKMSKSYGNGINIFDDEKQLKKQIMSIVTDSKGLADPKDPETCTIYQIYKLIVEPEKSNEMADRLKAGHYGYGDAKKLLLQSILETYDSMRQQYRYWMEHPKDLEEQLQMGAILARKKAQKMMERIKERVGL